MFNKFIVTLLFIIVNCISLNAQKDSTVLTIYDAVDKALKNNPELKIYLNKIEALKAVKLQESLFPNPEIEFEADNIFGTKDFNGFRKSEISAVLNQNILLAGKISKRVKIVESNILLSEWDYEIRRIELITDVRKAFQKALSIQTLMGKNKELIEISKEFISNLHNRIQAGKISPAEVSRAKIILNSLKIELNRLQFEYETNLSELLSLIYQPDLIIDSLKGKLNYPVKIPVYDSLLIKLENNPILQKYKSEFQKQDAVINLEKSNAIPDLTLSVGFKKLNDADVNTFLFGASIPLPFFNRNQGAIQKAKIMFDQKKEEYSTTLNRLTLRLKVLYKRLITLNSTAEQLGNESIPEAENAFKIIKEGNLVGRFAIIDVIDSERTLFELQNQYLKIIGEIHSVLIEIEGLTGIELK